MREGNGCLGVALAIIIVPLLFGLFAAIGVGIFVAVVAPFFVAKWLVDEDGGALMYVLLIIIGLLLHGLPLSIHDNQIFVVTIDCLTWFFILTGVIALVIAGWEALCDLFSRF